jgi:hypothetical protein
MPNALENQNVVVLVLQHAVVALVVNTPRVRRELSAANPKTLKELEIIKNTYAF